MKLKHQRGHHLVRTSDWRPTRLAETKRLFEAVDHGYPVTIPPDNFAGGQRGGWGTSVDTFLRFNRAAFDALDVHPDVGGGPGGVVFRIVPGGRAGAIPLRSGQSGQVAGGFLVKPRFGWPGVGSILSETGWCATPRFLDLPMVPGSARKVPPWVLAGPVLTRLAVLLRALKRGYREAEEMIQRPRGRILWNRYCAESLVRGDWHHLPCRFPDLDMDPKLRRHIRWALERIHRDLVLVAGTDPVALSLATIAMRLIDLLSDVIPLMPRRAELNRKLEGVPLLTDVIRRGFEALAWIVDERGLGGGAERDGLSWALQLEELWEQYVEAVYRREVAKVGGEIKVGRKNETVFPLHWSDPVHRTLGHLVPDLVIRHQRSVQIVDAKYKAHLAELTETAWYRFAEETRNAHRADLHQVLAYASLYDADEITATLVYPLRQETFDALAIRHRDVSIAELLHGGRRVRLELRGLPFGHE